jgi:uncharacterized phage-associated protein
MKLTPEIIAGCIAEKCNVLGIRDTSKMKLQKLTFFAWVWYGVLYGKRLFDEEPEAWAYGPYFLSLGKATRDYKDDPIQQDDLKRGCDCINDLRILAYIDDIVANYGQFSAYELKSKSHNDLWEQAYKTDSQTMFWDDAVTYYKNNLIESVMLEEDKKAGVFTAVSHIIHGLVLEYDSYSELLSEVQEIAADLIEENCKSAAN